MKSSKNNFTSITIDKYPSSIKNQKKILIPKIIMNDPFKNKIKQNHINNIKLPSIKCSSTKNAYSKYDLNDFQEYSIIKNHTLYNSLINKNNNNNINLYNDNIQDNSNHIYKNKSQDNIKNINYIYDYKYKNIPYNYNKKSNNINLKKSSSAIFSPNSYKLISKYGVKNIFNFHKNLMAINKISYDKSLRQNYINITKEENIKKDNYINNILKNKSKKDIKTGIFGPSNNIVSVIRAKMERLKYDKIYKGVDDDIKELIKDEIMDAQVKLKREPQNLIVNKNGIIPLYIKKMNKYKYLSKMNKIRQLNHISITPVLAKDKNIMYKLFNDAFDILRKEKRNDE